MNTPRVFLVGAGPGSAGLLTLRAVECLGRAEFILYDKLVPARLLDFAPASAERVCVADLPGCHPDRWPHIHNVMIEAARQGKCVVRLKGGDPLIFGRGGEEAEALEQAGIKYELVPGVTAALAAASCAGIPLTHRADASAVAFVTGHEDPEKPSSSLDWSALARFPGTLVFYMGMARLGKIVRALIENGKPSDTPAAIVHSAATGQQRTLEATLGELPGAAQAAGIGPPALVIFGPVVQRRPQNSWFEGRPLFGKRVLVTRPRHQAADLVRQLEELGASVSVLPVVEVRELTDWSAVDHILARLSEFNWLVFTSVNGVHAFLGRLKHVGKDLRALGHLQLAAIGLATADALRVYHLEPDLVPAEYRSEALATALRERAAGQRILLARADRGREVLREQLADVAQVEQVAVYSQVDAVDMDAEIIDSLRRGAIEFVTLTSSNIARAFLNALDEPCREYIRSGVVKLVTISPVTSEAVTALGFPVAGEAKEYTSQGLIRALLTLRQA